MTKIEFEHAMAELEMLRADPGKSQEFWEQLRAISALMQQDRVPDELSRG